MTSAKEREAFIDDRMKRWRASAQCQCAAHVMEALRDAGDSFDGLEKVKEFFDSTEGKKVKRNMARLVKRLERQQQEARRHPLKGIHGEPSTKIG
jgi:hypothetical protein